MSEHSDDAGSGFEHGHEGAGGHEPDHPVEPPHHEPGHVEEHAGAEQPWEEPHGQWHSEDQSETIDAGDHGEDLQAALASPGGTVFDLLPALEPAWFGDEPAGVLDAEQYAAGWAQDDGTGVIGALGWVGEDAHGATAPDTLGEATIPAYAAELIHGSDDELGARLWRELRPEDPLPLGPGGEPLPVDQLLAELARGLDDPVALNVVENVLGQLDR